MKDLKRRRPFVVENDAGYLLGFGHVYDDGSCQILWRQTLGFTGELHQTIASVFNIEQGATAVRLVDDYPTEIT